MFSTKQNSLLEVKKTQSVKSNSNFVNAALKKGAETKSGNGALKYSTTGDVFVDQFGVVGTYKTPRSFADISRDMDLAWASDKETAVRFALYLRMISRQTMYLDGTMTQVSQKGAEMKHEGIMRMLWLHFKDENAFWKNIGLFISVGSWKDVFTMLSYDLIYHGWEGRKLNWNKFGDLILSGLENSNTSDLVKKYLPQIKSNSACKTVESQADTIIAKWVSSLVFGNKGVNPGATYKQYRKLKTSGTAHEWQKIISKRQFDRIDFSKIHGRALSKLVQSKFLFNQGLSDAYSKWITAPETKEVKYTGFVHELFEPLNVMNRFTYQSISREQEETINKQFATLVQKGGEAEVSKLIVVRDTSSSMTSQATGTKMSAYNIGKALALYFSEFLDGPFANAWIEFSDGATMHTWKGNTPVEKWRNDKSEAYGSTNFQSVIKLFVTLKNRGVAEEDFPTGILCVSDGEFNPSEAGKTNVEKAKSTLLKAGFSKEYVDNFVIVLWNISTSYYGSGTGTKFETFGDVPGVFYFSGYSSTVVSLLSSKIKTARELFDAAMMQEVLQRVEL